MPKDDTQQRYVHRVLANVYEPKATDLTLNSSDHVSGCILLQMPHCVWSLGFVC